MLNEHDSSMLREDLRIIACELHAEQVRPSVLFRPGIYPDGDKWCALYGENLQEGVAGFGDSPDLAARAFDEAWHAMRNKGSTDGND